MSVYEFNPMYVAHHAKAVTPSDTTVLDLIGIYVGTGGNVALVLDGDASAVTFTNVAAGSVLAFGIQKVMSTGTTASGIVGLR
jgi:hypothetical protein